MRIFLYVWIVLITGLFIMTFFCHRKIKNSCEVTRELLKDFLTQIEDNKGEK